MNRSLVRTTFTPPIQLIDVLDSAEAENRPKSAHRYNVAEQQQIYKSEIERIWKAQFDSLSRKDEPQLSDEEEEKRPDKKPRNSISSIDAPMNSPLAIRDTPGPSSPAFSRASSVMHDRDLTPGPESQRRVLRIKRFVSIDKIIPRVFYIIFLYRSMANGRWRSFETLQSSQLM